MFLLNIMKVAYLSGMLLLGTWDNVIKDSAVKGNDIRDKNI